MVPCFTSDSFSREGASASMSYLSKQSLAEKLNQLVPNAQRNDINCVAIQLSVGPEIYITGNDTKTSLKDGEQFKIPSGQFALIITEERVTVPLDMIGFISIKFGLKKRGLINVSGFHVDPGFQGRLMFSVYNAGASDISLSRGTKTFMIWYSTLDKALDAKEGYSGNHQNQESISDADVDSIRGHIASPAALQAKLQRMELIGKIALIVMTSLIAPLFVRWYFSSKGEVTPTVLVLDLGSTSTVLQGVRLKLIPPDTLIVTLDSSRATAVEILPHRNVDTQPVDSSAKSRTGY